MESYALLDSLQHFITVKKVSGDKALEKKTYKTEKENSFVKYDPLSHQSSPKNVLKPEKFKILVFYSKV